MAWGKPLVVAWLDRDTPMTRYEITPMQNSESEAIYSRAEVLNMRPEGLMRPPDLLSAARGLLF